MTTAEPLILAFILFCVFVVLTAFLWFVLSSGGLITTVFMFKNIKRIRNTLKYYGTVNNTATPQMLKKSAYKGIAISFISLPAYILPIVILNIALSYIHFNQLLVTVMGYARLAIIADIIVKIVFYYFALKAIFVAKCTVMTDIPEPLPVVPKIKTTSSKYCPQCNKQVNEAMLFCTDCGCKLLNK